MTKMRQRLLVAATLAALMAPPMMASAAVDFIVKIAPPAPRVEVVPVARPGYVWAPGHWAWRSNRHVWVGGVYIRERPGYIYRPPVWVQGNGGWHQTGGTWARRDGDHDGVPNALDRDRDNDGIRNGPDKHPRNPVRP
jgi:hypothetical protein